MLECLFQLNVPLHDLSTVVIFAEISDFFPKLFKVVGSFHQFQLLPRVVLLRFA